MLPEVLPLRISLRERRAGVDPGPAQPPPPKQFGPFIRHIRVGRRPPEGPERSNIGESEASNMLVAGVGKRVGQEVMDRLVSDSGE